MDNETERAAALKKAIVEIRTLRSRLSEAERRFSEPIAIVGCALKFPGAADTDNFWRLLAEGRDAVTEIPRDRWDIDSFYDSDPDRPGKMYVRHGGFLTDIDCFDASFFGISPREACSMDPQQRVLLEVSWQALEDAGVAADRLTNSPTGVYIGISNSDYARLLFEDSGNLDVYASLGTNYSVIAGRLSYLLGLHGPSMALDTACSSSLVAVHLACQSLRSGESRLAMAGGVNLMLTPEVHVSFCKAGMLARDGHCKAFDAAADGYVRSEGCGIVVLKRLSDALADGDRIRAVIRGSAVNQDGRSSGLTAPNGPSQEAVIRAALANANLAPDAVDYVETHGTGTSLGDPIEFGAIGAALCTGRSTDRPLRIGSVKANLGHLEAAAGMAGLIKTVLCLEHQTLTPQIHFNTPSPLLDWAKWPIKVATSSTSWTPPPSQPDRPCIAGVSSFGFSGTNAHLIVEQAPTPQARGSQAPLAVVSVSGKTEDTRRASAGRLAAHLSNHPDIRLGDVAHTSNAGRAHHPFRSAIVAESSAELQESLHALAEGRQDPRTRLGWAQAGESPEVVFLFTGQGAQYPGMGRSLYDSCPVFRAELDRCASILSSELDVPLLELIYGDAGPKIYETNYAQPATFAFECALAAQWKAWGVTPSAVIGHSLGEYAAVCVAGALKLEDAAKLVATRGRLMHALPRGSMAAIFASHAHVLEAIAPWPGVSIASINSPETTVISGVEAEVAAVCEALTAQGYTCKPVRVSQAAHSPMVESMLDPLEAAARGVQMRDPEIELISNVTGSIIAKGQLNATYWRQHARSAVRFAEGLQALYNCGYRVFLEVGPRPTLTGFVSENLPFSDVCAVASMRPDADSFREMLDALAVLYSHGVSIAWPELDRGYDHRTISLPSYPFERDRFWFSDSRTAQPNEAAREPLFDTCVRRVRLQSEQAPFDLAPESFPQKWAALDRLALGYQTRALAELGAFSNLGESHDPESLCRAFGITPTYARLMRRWMDRLAEAGLLQADGPKFRVLTPLSPLPLEPALSEAAQELKDYPEFLTYVQICGPRLANVLTGQESALDLIFPNGSFDLADGLYHRSAVSRYLNGMVRSAVDAAAASLPSQRQLRVLEIGAGTGGTTAALLPWLDPKRTSYVFTDVSDVFLNRARERFSPYPFVSYRSLDIDRDPVEQGLSAGAFDVIIAANVLHATRNLATTVERVRSLLDEGGLLVLSETTNHPHAFDITTGLIEGWQVFDDTARADNPLISAADWVNLLTAAGFQAAAAFPETGPATALGNHVIIASRPGEAFAKQAEPLAISSIAARAHNTDTKPALSKVDQATKADQSLVIEELRKALPSERRERLAETARDAVMEILRLDAKRRPSLRDRLMALGFDSLMAVQLRNRLAAFLGNGIRLPATLVFDHPSCEDIGAYLAGLIEEKIDKNGPGEANAPVVHAAINSQPISRDHAASTAIEELSDEEAEAALLMRLEQIEGKAK
jgi:acyl transferase domain-containing protein/SAM-dependent methyltransferase